MNVDFNKTYTLSDEIVTRNNKDGTVVLMRMDDSEVFYKINGVAAQVWKEIEAGKTPEAIIPELVEEYDCTEEQLKGDTEKFLVNLLEKEILS